MLFKHVKNFVVLILASTIIFSIFAIIPATQSQESDHVIDEIITVIPFDVMNWSFKDSYVIYTNYSFSDDDEIITVYTNCSISNENLKVITPSEKYWDTLTKLGYFIEKYDKAPTFREVVIDNYTAFFIPCHGIITIGWCGDAEEFLRSLERTSNFLESFISEHVLFGEIKDFESFFESLPEELDTRIYIYVTHDGRCLYCFDSIII